MKHKRILTSIAMAALVLVSLCALSASTLSVSAAQGSSANVQATGVVGAPVGAGAPAAYAVDSTHVYLFIRGGGGSDQLYVKVGTLTGAVWNWAAAATPLGGKMTSAPVATASGATTLTSGVIDIFYRGSDGAIYDVHYSLATQAVTGWQRLGGTGIPLNVAPGACSWGSGRFDVFVQGSDGALWHKYSSDTGKSWSNWLSLSGKLTSAPSATAMASPNQIGVFARGSDGVVWEKFYSASNGWAGWASVSGQVYAGTSPAAYNWGATQIGYFITGTDLNLYHIWKAFSAGGNISGYVNLGSNGALTSSPGATSTTGTAAQTTINVFVRGATGDFTVLWQRSYGTAYAPGGWSDWILVGGV